MLDRIVQRPQAVKMSRQDRHGIDAERVIDHRVLEYMAHTIVHITRMDVMDE